MWYPKYTPRFWQRFFSTMRTHYPPSSTGPCLYLTFDDGPTAEYSRWILDQLASYQAKASFFCLGKNVAALPALAQATLAEGHCLAMHGYAHLNGWKSSTADYLADLEKAEQFIQSRYFRPAYGRIRPSQAKAIRAKGYEIIAWEIIPGDFDAQRSPQQSMQLLKKKAQDGSIIVLHDSLKAGAHLRALLPELLAYFTAKGYSFKALP